MGKIKQNHIVICMEERHYLQKDMLKAEFFRKIFRDHSDSSEEFKYRISIPPRLDVEFYSLLTLDYSIDQYKRAVRGIKDTKFIWLT